MTRKTIIAPLTAALLVTGCVGLGETEEKALWDTAIRDARNAPKAVHLGYLQCYALPDYDKDSCRRRIKDRPVERQKANTWEYIRPYDYEAERLGFTAFLKDHGKRCSGIDQGVRYNSDKKAFIAKCKDGNDYLMRFDRKTETWSVLADAS